MGRRNKNKVFSNLEVIDAGAKGKTIAKAPDGKVVFLPNTISVEWVYELNKSNKLGLYAQTVGFGRFGNYVGASYYTDVKENIRLKNTVGIGDFTGFQWNEAVELRLNSTNIFVSAIGLNSLLVPSDSHSYGIALGATKLF